MKARQFYNNKICIIFLALKYPLLLRQFTGQLFFEVDARNLAYKSVEVVNRFHT